jgi:UDP-N-acetylmuramoyl-L-alanyl-D-glutamate--2,6-diaminopimelate ligase
VKLRDLLRDVPVRKVEGDLDRDVSAVLADSRLVAKGALFVAIPGLQTDGAKFITQALQKGAAAIVTGAPSPASDAAVIARRRSSRSWASRVRRAKRQRRR